MTLTEKEAKRFADDLLEGVEDFNQKPVTRQRNMLAGKIVTIHRRVYENE